MLENYRKTYPADKRSDGELLQSLMDHFVESGLIQKKDGKYLLGPIEDPDRLARMLSSFKN